MSLDRTEAVLALLSNEVTLPELAQRHCVSEEEVAQWRELFLQGARAGYRRTAIARPVRRSRAILGAALASMTGLLLAGVAFAQTVTCTQTLPVPLVTFCANAPALAATVNGNFQTVYGWLAQKVGTPGAAAVAMTSTLNVAGATTLASSLNVTGNSTLGGNLSLASTSSQSFGSATRQMISLFNSDYGIGVQASTTYLRSGGGFAFYRAGLHSDAQNSNGGGTTLATLDTTSGLTVGAGISAGTSLKSRGTSVIKDVTTCCQGSAGDCCPGGYTLAGVDLNTGTAGSFCYLCIARAD